MSIQLDLFLPQKTIVDCIQEDLKTVKTSNDKVRKSMFASHNELKKKYIDLNERMEIIERNICRGISEKRQQ